MIIARLAQNGYDKESLNFFKETLKTNLKPYGFIMASVLSVCTNLVALESGKQFHTHIIARGLDKDVVVCSALVGMYAKSGILEDAYHVFDHMHQWNVIS